MFKLLSHSAQLFLVDPMFFNKLYSEKIIKFSVCTMQLQYTLPSFLAQHFQKRVLSNIEYAPLTKLKLLCLRRRNSDLSTHFKQMWQGILM